MIFSFKRIVTGVLALNLATVAWGQTQVPHTFESGQPARASEVNENFASIETAVNDNDGRITDNGVAISVNTEAIAAGDAAIRSRLSPIVLDGADNEIGQLISIGENHWSIEVITQQGYLLTLSPRSGTLGTGTFHFESSDCTGTPYTNDSFGGYVENTYDPSGLSNLHYVDKSSVPITDFTSASISYSDGCFAQVSVGLTVFPALPNDPAITGVSSNTFQLPIKIERLQ